MNSYIDYKELQIDENCKKNLLKLYDKYMNHEFDLLGSGFIQVKYRMEVKGFHGTKYTPKYFPLKKNKNLSSEYIPINWFIDYRSGFEFLPMVYNTKEKCLSSIGKRKGVEIKCPWELGRFYHLVQLAIIAIFDCGKRNKILLEFKNQVFDFFHSNPVGKTIQWAEVMDVAIRNVNFLISYDILKQLDVENILDNKFENLFEKLIYEETVYIINNLEYLRRGINTNHYLCDLAGIAYGAAYLKSNSETDAWLVFSVQELIEQVEKQFYEEGSNIEGSTSYHRLSTEFFLYTTALILGVVKGKRKVAFSYYDKKLLNRLLPYNRQKYDIESEYFFPQWYIDRLFNAAKYTEVVLKQNSEIVQIGDNDSGRLIKLTPVLKEYEHSLEENVLNHTTLLSAIRGLFETTKFNNAKIQYPLEYSFVCALSQKKIKSLKEKEWIIDINNTFDESELENYKYYKKITLYHEDNGVLNQNSNIFYYKEVGLLIYRNKRIFISLIVGKEKKPVLACHMHNDTLSMEVMVDNQYITRDPGSYVYTSMPQIRDKFRGVNAHNTIRVEGIEQNEFADTFNLKYKVKGNLLFCNDNKIIAKAVYEKIEHIRVIKIEANEIIVEDYCNFPFKVGFKNKIYSTGYGEIYFS